MIFRLLGKRRRIAIDNVLKSDLGLDEAAAADLARQSFRSLARTIAETVLARKLITRETMRRHVSLECPPEVRTYLTDPTKGALVAAGHLGNWEVALRAGSLFKPMHGVYRPLNNPFLNADLNSGRAGENLNLISKRDFAAFRPKTVLARGELLGLMIDQHIGPQHKRVRVKFLGREAWAPRSVAIMAMAAKVPVIVAGTRRVGPMRFVVHASKPLFPEDTGDHKRDAEELTRRMTAELEKIVRLCPEQYLWGHRRWRD